MSDSIRINNWLTFVSIIMITTMIGLYSKYIAKPLKQKPKIVAKFYNKQNLKDSYTLLDDGYYKVDGIIKNKNIILSTLQINKIFKNLFKINQKDGIKLVLIKYKITTNQILCKAILQHKLIFTISSKLQSFDKDSLNLKIKQIITIFLQYKKQKDIK